MDKEVEQSHIQEFLQYKDKIISYVDNSTKKLVGILYGSIELPKEFWYNRINNTAFIHVDETSIEVTKYL